MEYVGSEEEGSLRNTFSTFFLNKLQGRVGFVAVYAKARFLIHCLLRVLRFQGN